MGQQAPLPPLLSPTADQTYFTSPQRTSPPPGPPLYPSVMSRGGVVGGGVMGHIPESGGRELSFHALLGELSMNLLITQSVGRKNWHYIKTGF